MRRPRCTSGCMSTPLRKKASKLVTKNLKGTSFPSTPAVLQILSKTASSSDVLMSTAMAASLASFSSRAAASAWSICWIMPSCASIVSSCSFTLICWSPISASLASWASWDSWSRKSRSAPLSSRTEFFARSKSRRNDVESIIFDRRPRLPCFSIWLHMSTSWSWRPLNSGAVDSAAERSTRPATRKSQSLTDEDHSSTVATFASSSFDMRNATTMAPRAPAAMEMYGRCAATPPRTAPTAAHTSGATSAAEVTAAPTEARIAPVPVAAAAAMSSLASPAAAVSCAGVIVSPALSKTSWTYRKREKAGRERRHAGRIS
mmetsp:Transcript_45759/g.143144  ORF Transcript_45759/g.143144 Transcript_45759/m.143144 type:complete len:318 (+) Transcript_45759:600-1553(+)